MGNDNWYKTGCVLCPQSCGTEVRIEDNKIVEVRGDKDNPRSRGYICRKGRNIAYHQHNADRIKYPLKQVDGEFKRISWDDAIGEIAEKLSQIIKEHSSRSIAYLSGGGPSHLETTFGVTLLRSLGSRYHYSSLAQEFSGFFWSQGRIIGKQYKFPITDEARSDVLVGVGWNGMVSHQTPRAPVVLREFSKNPDKTLVIIDPRKSETAKIANIHLAIRPGTDALLFKAMIALVLKEGWIDREYINKHVSGFDKIKGWFTDFDIKEAIKVCELDYEEVKEVCRLIYAKKAACHPDLGVYMNRHSTLTTYLLSILFIITGNYCVPGGNVVPGYLMPICSHTDERDEKTWCTVETGIPAFCGVFPPNVLPEEILSNNKDRLRAVLCCQSNALRSYADTTMYEKAFSNLDLLVVYDIALTETARFANYVLPSRSAYESYDGFFFEFTYPEIYFQLRRPLIKPDGEQLEMSEMHTKLADKLGLIPTIPKELYDAAKEDRITFGMELMNYLSENPDLVRKAPFIVAKTLGREMGSVNLAQIWTILMTAPKKFRENAARAGFTESPLMGEEIFQAILNNPQGLWIGKMDIYDNFSEVTHDDHKLDIYIPEMKEWCDMVTPKNEEKDLKIDKKYPLLLLAGRHMPMNANTMMRNPEWNKGQRACTCAMNPNDANKLGLEDGQIVKVTTDAGSVEIELEITDETREGMVIIPHGFGLIYNGREYGANVNRLTNVKNRDRFAATPYHRYVFCNVESV